MDNLEKKCAEYEAMLQQSARLAARAAPVIAVAASLQEAVNLNQLLARSVSELLEALKNERQAKGPKPDGAKVPGETRSAPT